MYYQLSPAGLLTIYYLQRLGSNKPVKKSSCLFTIWKNANTFTKIHGLEILSQKIVFVRTMAKKWNFSLIFVFPIFFYGLAKCWLFYLQYWCLEFWQVVTYSSFFNNKRKKLFHTWFSSILRSLVWMKLLPMP